MKVVKRFELNAVEKDLVDAIWVYMHRGDKESENVGYDMLDALLRDILRKRGHENDLGESADWERDDWESIVIYHDKEHEENQKQILGQMDAKYGNKSISEIESDLNTEDKQKSE